MFISITLRQDVFNFSSISQIIEISPSYLFNVRIEGHILVKNDSKIPDSLTRGQTNAIQSKYLVRCHVSKI